MPARDFQIVFTADTSQAVAGMKMLGSEFRALESYINGTGSGLGNMTSQLNDLTHRCNVAADSINSIGQSSRGMLGSMLGMQAGFLVVQGGIEAIAGLGEMANKAREHIKELAIDTMDLREEMRELANLKGAGGPDNIIAGETVEMAVDAGMMPEQMVKYLEQFEGSVPAGEQKGHIDARTKKELALEGAKFANRVGLSPATGGDLAGVISQYTDLTKDKDRKAIPQDQRTARAMSQMGRVEYGLNMGRGKIETLTRSLINTAGAVVGMGGPVEDLGDLAAIQGVASTHANPKESGTRVRQAVRALRDTKGDVGLFLTKGAGIKDTDDHVTRLEKIKVQVDKAKASGKQGDTFLRDMGFSDEEEMRAILEQVEDLDLIKKRIAEGRAKVTGKAVMDKDGNFQTKERVGMRLKQKAAKAGQEFLIGEGNERVEMAKENAEQRMRKSGEIGGGWNNFLEWAADAGGLGPKMGRESQRESSKYYAAERHLIDEAKRVGIPKEKAMEMLGYRNHADQGWSDMARDEGGRRQGFNALATEVERKGGNALGNGPDLKPDLKAIADETRETNRLLRQIAGQQQPVPPALPPVRAAAQPKRP